MIGKKEEVNKVFISYLDEDNQKISGIVDLISKDQITLTFKTKQKKITIPTSRLLKLKEDIEGVV